MTFGIYVYILCILAVVGWLHAT